jgi:hypothetical protein
LTVVSVELSIGSVDNVIDLGWNSDEKGFEMFVYLAAFVMSFAISWCSACITEPHSM